MLLEKLVKIKALSGTSHLAAIHCHACLNWQLRVTASWGPPFFKVHHKCHDFLGNYILHLGLSAKSKDSCRLWPQQQPTGSRSREFTRAAHSSPGHVGPLMSPIHLFQIEREEPVHSVKSLFLSLNFPSWRPRVKQISSRSQAFFPRDTLNPRGHNGGSWP